MIDGFSIGIALNVELNGLGKLTELSESLTKINSVVSEVEAKMASLGAAINTAFSSVSVASFNAELRNSLSTVRQLTSAMGQVHMGAGAAPTGGGRGAGATTNAASISQAAAISGMSQRSFDRVQERAERDNIAFDDKRQNRVNKMYDQAERADFAFDSKRDASLKRAEERNGMLGGSMLGSTFKMLAGFEALKLGEKGLRAAAEFDTEKATLRGQGYTENQIDKMVQGAANTHVAGLNITDKLIGQQELNAVLDPGGVKGLVTPALAKSTAEIAQYITKETGHGSVASNQVIVARAAQLMGVGLKKDGTFDPKSLENNAVMFGRMVGAMGRNTDPELFAHNIKQASQYLRDTTGRGMDLHQFAQLGVLTEQLGAQGGSAFASLSRQAARGEVAGSQGRMFLQHFGLFGGEHIGQAFGFDPLAKGGKGAMGVMDRTAVMKGFDPAHPELYHDVMRNAIIATLTREGGGKAPDQKRVDNFMAQWENMRAGRAESTIGTPTGLEEVKKLQEAYNLTAPDAEGLANSIHNFDGGLEALGKSLGSVIALLGAPVMHDLGSMFYKLSTGLDAIGGFLSEHQGISDSLVRVGEALVGLAALSLGSKAAVWLFKAALDGLLLAITPVKIAIQGLIATFGIIPTALAGIVAATLLALKIGSDNETPEMRAAREKNRQDMGPTSPTNLLPQDGFDVSGRPLTPLTPLTTGPSPREHDAASMANAVANPAIKAIEAKPAVRPVPPVSPMVQHTWTGLPVTHGGGSMSPGFAPPGSPFQPTALQSPVMQSMPPVEPPKPPDVKLADFYAKNLYVDNIVGWGGKGSGSGSGSTAGTGTGTSANATAGVGGGMSPRITGTGASPSLSTGMPSRGLPVGGMHGGGRPNAPAVPYEPGSILSGMHITKAQYDATKEAIGGIESHGKYDIMGGSSGRFAGKYQMGRAEINETAAKLGVPPPSQQQFLHDPAMQEKFMEAYTMSHHQQLMKSPEYAALSPEQQLKVLGYAHNQGAGGAAKWLKTHEVRHDAFGTQGTVYPDAIGKALSKVPPTQVGIPSRGSMDRHDDDPDKGFAGRELVSQYNQNEQNRIMPPPSNHTMNSQVDIHLDDQVIASHMFKNMFDFNPSGNAGPTGFDKRMSPWAPGSSMPR